MPDFIAREGDTATGIELDYDYHLRRRHGSLRGLYNRFCRSLELQLIKREADRLGRPLDMLDVGCGNPTRSNSTYHAQLFPLARLYIGIEPSLPLASRVHPLPSVGLVRASGELRVLRDQVVDMALSFRALDRCVDPDRTLANMAAALRPQGHVLISLVNKNVWYRAASNGVHAMLALRSSSNGRRSVEMSPDDLRRRLESVGFQDVEVYDLLYFSGLVQSKAFDWVLALFGEQWCAAALRQADRVGRLIAPERGGMFVALARKLQNNDGETKGSRSHSIAQDKNFFLKGIVASNLQNNLRAA
ncbi:MAG: methyltransferase domain-containing protein [Candidatus Binatia bacterium]